MSHSNRRGVTFRFGSGNSSRHGYLSRSLDRDYSFDVSSSDEDEYSSDLVSEDEFSSEENDDDELLFFNPFDEIIMSAVVNNIFESLQNNPRKLHIIYVNPLHKEQFLKAGYTEKWYSKKMKYIEAVILGN